jgi:hypothetical protein
MVPFQGQVSQPLVSEGITMKVQHLKRPSPSGDYEELFFDVGNDAEWFLFRPEDREDWVGVFGHGFRGENFAIVSADDSFTMVVSNGMAYAIDNSSRTMLFKEEDDLFLRGGIAIPGGSRVLLFGIDDLYIYDRTGMIWDEDLDTGFEIQSVSIHGDEAWGMMIDCRGWGGISKSIPLWI